MKNQKLMMILLVLSMAAAIALGTVLILHTNDLRDQIRKVEDGIEVSFAAWNKTSAEKEALQKDLKAINNDLKEADVTLTESLERAEELEADIAQLLAEEKRMKAILAGGQAEEP